MALIAIISAWELGSVCLLWIALLGFIPALWERFDCAPRSRLSLRWIAFCSGIVPAGFAVIGGTFMSLLDSGDELATAMNVAIIACGIFCMNFTGVLVVFHVSRRLLRTKFTDEESPKEDH